MKRRVKSFRGEGHDVDCGADRRRQGYDVSLEVAKESDELDIGSDVSSNRVRVERKAPRSVSWRSVFFFSSCSMDIISGDCPIHVAREREGREKEREKKREKRRARKPEKQHTSSLHLHFTCNTSGFSFLKFSAQPQWLSERTVRSMSAATVAASVRGFSCCWSPRYRSQCVCWTDSHPTGVGFWHVSPTHCAGINPAITDSLARLSIAL